jgi:GxxExxY protein
MLRVPTRLSDELEDLIYRTIGCCIAVHRELGPGLLESIYSRAICMELGAESIRYERERLVPVVYRNQVLCSQRVDLVVEQQLVLEVKAVERFHPVHEAQVLSYLHLTKLPIGLLINFNVAVLKAGVKRIVL